MTPSQKTCKCQNNSKSLHPYMYQYIFCYIFSFWIVVFLCRIVLIVLCVFQALTIINFTLFICVCCNSKCHYYSSPDYYWMDHRLLWHCVQVFPAYWRNPRWRHVLHWGGQAWNHRRVWIQQWDTDFHHHTWLDGMLNLLLICDIVTHMHVLPV